MSSSSLKITLKNGVIGATQRQKQTVLGLGLKYRHSTRQLKDTPAIRGMVHKVAHLVKIVQEEPKKKSFFLVPEYELGAVSEKVIKPKKEKAHKEKLELSEKEDVKQVKKNVKSISKKVKTGQSKKQKTKSEKTEKKITKKSVKKVKKS